MSLSDTNRSSREARRRSYGWFLVWVGVGFVTTFGILVFGAPALLLVGVLAILLARRHAIRRPAFGALAGAGLVALLVAYLNREGPGFTCWHTSMASGCGEHLNPWPWLAAGIVLVVAGFVGQGARSGRAARS
jgi:hypothetical protein